LRIGRLEPQLWPAIFSFPPQSHFMAGRNPPQIYTSRTPDPVRYLLVRNTMTTAAPPFCLLAELGMDADGVMLVGQPSENGQGNLVVNARTPIPAFDPNNPQACQGQAIATFPVAIAFEPDNPASARPSEGEIWGARKGSWFLHRGFPGFKIIQAGSGSLCSCDRMDGKRWETSTVTVLGVNVFQTITLVGATGGTFTLTYGGNTTAAIAYNATPAAVQAALILLASIGSGNAVVLGIPGQYNVAVVTAGTLSGSAAGLTGSSPSITLTTLSFYPGTRSIMDLGLAVGVANPPGYLTKENVYLLDRRAVPSPTVADKCDGAFAGLNPLDGVPVYEFSSYAGAGGGDVDPAPPDTSYIVDGTVNLTAGQFLGNGQKSLQELQIYGGLGIDKVYTLSLGSPSAGNFTLTVSGQTTGPIPYNASAATILAALTSLSTVGAAGASVTGGNPFTITLYPMPTAGALSGNGAGLTGGSFSVVAAAAAGSPTFSPFALLDINLFSEYFYNPPGTSGTITATKSLGSFACDYFQFAGPITGTATPVIFLQDVNSYSFSAGSQAIGLMATAAGAGTPPGLPTAYAGFTVVTNGVIGAGAGGSATTYGKYLAYVDAQSYSPGQLGFPGCPVWAAQYGFIAMTVGTTLTTPPGGGDPVHSGPGGYGVYFTRSSINFDTYSPGPYWGKTGTAIVPGGIYARGSGSPDHGLQNMVFMGGILTDIVPLAGTSGKSGTVTVLGAQDGTLSSPLIFSKQTAVFTDGYLVSLTNPAATTLGANGTFRSADTPAKQITVVNGLIQSII
jgi:hypothetical protein